MSASICINDILNVINLNKEKGEKVIVVTLDVSCAYECVDINTLYTILQSINCPKHISSWIYSFLSKRFLVMGNNEIEILNGVPQGSCLSPTIFNIYTSRLHEIADQNTHIFQFADDFIILTHDHDFDNAVKVLQNKVLEFAAILLDLKLKINGDKSAVMYVAKGARKTPLISLTGKLIKPTLSIKFLGRKITNSLSLKEHYDDIVYSCRNSLNAIKMLTSLKYGLHPSIATNITKSIIFSKTEYLISSMAHTPKYLNKRINTFQNPILKRNLGLTKITPNHIAYALAGVLPPQQRSQYLAAKEILKLKIHNKELYCSITSNATNKTSLGLVYTKFKDILINTVVNIKVQASRKVQIELNAFPSNKNTINKDCFLAIYRQKVNDLMSEGFAILATDASPMENSTGCSVCNISTKENFAYKIADKVSSLTGELHAIEKAVDIIIEDGICKSAIFTDSKNACLLLGNNTQHNYLINEILRKINNSMISKLSLIWTPSHVGIPPNELADHFARHAADAGCLIESKHSVKDAQNKIKNLLWNEWVDNYKTEITKKYTFFSHFYSEPPSKPWKLNDEYEYKDEYFDDDEDLNTEFDINRGRRRRFDLILALHRWRIV
ncbi:uncharacterized protein LOC142224547 [Haematobia irritans]|uniref:uncharacterized protein LOC142224547 n=1 Tax=Haematobia irritans TaxID=7368 RepID=UPI003F503CC0